MTRQAPPVDLDRILDAIREEASLRGASRRPGFEARDQAQSNTGMFRRPPLSGQPRHVRDFLVLSSEALLDAAYRRLLNRPPDAIGMENYRRLLRTGRRTKVEVLGLIRYSGEGRSHAVPVSGLGVAFVSAMIYRIPVVGFVAALAATILRLPPYLRDRSSLEYGAQEAASELEG
jgi:hypothetical protein